MTQNANWEVINLPERKLAKCTSVHCNILIKVDIEKSRGEVSLVEQDTTENVS